MIPGLAFRTAENHVRHYEQESHDMLAEHRDAMDCRDCETFLQIAIDAFDWLMRADRAVRLAYASGHKYDAELDRAFQQLCKAWLGPCDQASQWAAAQIERGYAVENLPAFLKCCDEMRAIVEFNETDHEAAGIPLPLAELCDNALNEYANGETSEFV